MRKRLTVTLMLLLCVALFITFNNTLSPVRLFQQAVQNIFSIPKLTLYNMKTTVFVNKNDTLEKLREENRKLSVQLADYTNLKKENDALRSQFAESKQAAQKMLAAQVVGFEGNNLHPTKLVINRGSLDGIQQSMSVVVGKNLVGVISTVSPHYSLITLPVHPDFSVTGKTVQSNAEGVVTGKNDFILIDHIVITDKLSENDIVVTKGQLNAQGVGLIPDVVIGKVASVSRVESQPFQNAKLESQLNFAKLNTVFVILP